MPKPLFFQLPKEKQEAIRQAAFDEFSSAMFSDASINHIVQVANIARGSFYLYFDDKLDVYLYTTQRLLEQQSELFLAYILDNEPDDIFGLYRSLLMFTIETFSNDMSQYMKNLYLGMNYEIWTFIKSKQRQLKEKVFSELPSITTITWGIQVTPPSESLIDLLELIQRDLIVSMIVNELSKEEILSMYESRIDLLQPV